MANPVLDRSFGENAVPDAAITRSQQEALGQRGPVAADTMSIAGVSRATATLLALLLAGGVYGWNTTQATLGIPGWYLWAVLGLVALAFVIAFRPNLAPILGPVYALAQGALLGVISRVYEAAFDGVVLNAVLATLATFVGMLVLYSTGVIRATPKFRKIIMGATLGVMLFYVLSLVLMWMGVPMTFVWDSSPLGIGISLVVIAIAALNLVLDFDFVDRGVAAGLASKHDWLAAFGLMVTIVWLYLEFLRLFARLQNR